MKYLILNEIYNAFLYYHLFLSCYIFKYIIIIDGERSEYGENSSDGESLFQTRFYLCGDENGDSFGGRGWATCTGTVKQSPTLFCPIVIPTYCKRKSLPSVQVVICTLLFQGFSCQSYIHLV